MNLKEFKEIYDWVDSKFDKSSARVMGMAIQVAKVINSHETKEQVIEKGK